MSKYIIGPLQKTEDIASLVNDKNALEEHYSSLISPDDYPFIEKVIRSQLYHFFVKNDI